MDNISNTDSIINFSNFSDHVHRLKKKKYFLPFSPYQINLFLIDYLVIFLSCYVALFFCLKTFNNSFSRSVIFISILTLALLAFFPVCRLYSYHVVFRKKIHFQNLLKAYFWSLVILSVIYLIYEWPSLFRFESFHKLLWLLVFGFLIAFFNRLHSEYYGHILLAIGSAFIFVGISGLLIGGVPSIFREYPSYWLKIIIFSMASVLVVRFFVVNIVYNKWLRRYFRRQMLIIGENDYAQEITQYVIDNDAPFWIAGFVTVHNTMPVADVEIKHATKKHLGNITQLPHIIYDHQINEIIVTDEKIDKRSLIMLLDFAVSNGIVVWFPPSLLPIIPMKLKIDDFCGLPMIRMCLQRNPAFFQMIKRVVDLILASILVVIFSPIFILVAIAIKLDSQGPIFYKAEMVGKDGRRFKMLKFRSMYVDGDPRIHQEFVTKYITGELDPSKAKVLKITNDPRVTRVGKIIRRLSVDELPQLFNVLKGDMSLVGPRPCLPYEYELYKDWHRKRNSVLPGITGLWQITGRSEVAFEDMILLDLYYIYNRNLLLDISILFETIFVVLKMKGAY